MEQTNPQSPWYPYIWVDSKRMGGEPCFRGTRLPVRVLFEYLSGGQTLDDFLADFDGVKREVLAAVLELSAKEIERTTGAAA
jgi:uncharacterized protein (DUF433 family)